MPALLRSPPWPPLHRMYVLTIETERGAAAKVLGRTGSEGVRGMFREQSWKCCLWVSYTLPMQTEFPRFGGLRSEICRLAPCIMVHYFATTAYYRW
jgi:hypothetical protein